MKIYSQVIRGHDKNLYCQSNMQTVNLSEFNVSNFYCSRLPPEIDGVGDYALSLARQLRLDFGIEMHFIVCDPTWAGATEIEDFRLTK